MKKNQESSKSQLEKTFRLAYALILSMLVLVLFLTASTIYLITDPSLSLLRRFEASAEEPEASVSENTDLIENGIHVETGFIDAPGMMVTIQNCTNCHSSKLVIANRMNEERWIQTIRWMQETQNLWDLGENEKIIVDYLVTNYPPKKVGRRANLQEIEWYPLEE
ncbi:hypothetical protein [Algoriphagus namhaensis]